HEAKNTVSISNGLDVFTDLAAEVAGHADVGTGYIRIRHGHRCTCSSSASIVNTCVVFCDGTRLTQLAGAGVGVAAPAVEQLVLLGAVGGVPALQVREVVAGAVRFVGGRIAHEVGGTGGGVAALAGTAAARIPVVVGP